jgi:hypothetical protein
VVRELWRPEVANGLTRRRKPGACLQWRAQAPLPVSRHRDFAINDRSELHASKATTRLAALRRSMLQRALPRLKCSLMVDRCLI